MHYACEVLIPPVELDDLDRYLEDLMEPFSAHRMEPTTHERWFDYWDIGGQFAGDKLRAALDVQEDTDPAVVRARWQQRSPRQDCPLPVVGGGYIAEDALELAEALTLTSYTCSYVMFVSAAFQPQYVLIRTPWTGQNFLDSTWDGTLSHALAMWDDTFAEYSASFRKKHRPADDWLAVTVDCHL